MLKDAAPVAHPVCIVTGAPHVRSPCADDEPPLPDDIDDGTRHVELPDKPGLDLGRDLVFDFADKVAPYLADAVRSAFARRGAYRAVKAILERHGLVGIWDAYEHEATKAALTGWAQAHGFTGVTGDED